MKDNDYVSVETPKERPETKLDDDKPPKKILPLGRLLSYADTTDKLLMIGGTLAAIVSGGSQPIQIVLIGSSMDAFNPTVTKTSSEIRHDINRMALNYVLLGLVIFLSGFVQVTCWNIAAARQAKRIRAAYVQAILRKDIGWFDVNEPLQLATRVADTTVTIQEGLGRKVADGIMFASMAVGGMIVGLVKGWELTLVTLACCPLLAFSAYFSMKAIAAATQSGVESYGKAGAIAEEALSNICTVHMFNAIEHFGDKYAKALKATIQAGVKKGVATGFGTGMLYASMYIAYALGLYYGAVKISNDRIRRCTGSGCYTASTVIIVFFTVVNAAMASGQAGPSVQALYSARAAAGDVFETIEAASEIDPLTEEGDKLDKVDGGIEICNVTFAYPSRPEVNVCSDYSLTINPGETVALVGSSGCGKSTIVSLLERFYDPQCGQVRIDGVDIRRLNVKWLRQQIGLVGQEPTLFATSIMENIRYGMPHASDDAVIEAARMANAYDFVHEFPQGFQTQVGERGVQLSGGQKQRIAIARAIIKNPPILLLDEATSALDAESEQVVQESLDHLMGLAHRTTIIVAHRLSTIRNADKIAVHNDGSIVELGTHNDLMKIEHGVYRTLVEAQSRHKNESDVLQHNFQMSMSMGSSRHGSFLECHSVGQDVEVLDNGGDVIASKEKAAEKGSVLRMWKLSGPEFRFMALGSIGAFVNAASFPVCGVLMSKIMLLLFEGKPKHEMLADARWWSFGFVVLAIAFAASICVQNYGFAVASQRLVARVRLMTFKSMLQQEIGWYDLDDNSSGALTARLATDSATLQAITSDTLNQGLVSTTSLVIGLGVCYYYSWRLTTLAIGCTPMFIFAQFIGAQMMNGTAKSKSNNDADAAAGSLLSESIGSIRTVASFGLEERQHSAYAQFLDTSKAADYRAGFIGGFVLGFSQGIMLFFIALLYWIGGKWWMAGKLTFEAFMIIIWVMLMSTAAVGVAAQNAGDQTKAKKAAVGIFSIIDREPKIDSTSNQGETIPDLTGRIHFRNIDFAYPSRPDAQIYNHYDLTIGAGQTVALVGASGSGKSTAISLLERFYDPSFGAVTLDGIDISKLQLPWLRQRISLVSQEPVLFTGTIAENIALGKPDAARDEIEDAAKKANAFSFISNFPQGFDTDVGDRGVQVSGGQKQRIAIARAILRDPEVLLLDEATSALDNESERVVQDSLDRLLEMKKRTTVIVAHRLSTIRNADLIAVTKEGAIVEQGTHAELMARPHGVYRALVARQMESMQ